MRFDPERINMFWKALAVVTLAALFYLEMTRIEIIPAPQGTRFVERQTVGGIDREKARYRVCRYRAKDVQCSLWAYPVGF